jgi:hypothetical protein
MEPERRIEKWLRAFAKKRREQAGDALELRPAARQRLQREVERLGKGGSRGWFASLFFGLRPGLAFAVCFAALAVIGGILLTNYNRPQPANTLSLAKLSERKLASKAEERAIAPPPVSVNAPVSVEQQKVFVDKRAEDQTVLKSAPTVAAPTVIAGANRETIAAQTESAQEADRNANTLAQSDLSVATKFLSVPPATSSFAFKNESMVDSSAKSAGELNKDASSATRAVAPQTGVSAGNAQTFAANELQRPAATTQPSAPPAATGAAVWDESKTALAAATPSVSQLYYRSDALAKRQRAGGGGGAGAPPLLESFRVEQNGNAMKIIDGDGSVYTGLVQFAQSATNGVAGRGALSESRIADSHALTPVAQNYFFRVAGTNRNLNQNVIFSGNFVPFTNAQFATEGQSFGGMGGGGGIGGRRAASASTPTAERVLYNLRISGKAVIGGEKEVDVNATPAR